jgi:hypothetical protein
MMLFILGDKTSLPQDLQPYYDGCIARCPVMPEEPGKICYLTIAEGWVAAEQTQRRAGIHVEAPGTHTQENGSKFVTAVEHRWGCGYAHSDDEWHGGLFMASSLSNTCAVWNALVDTTTGAVDRQGGMELLRPYLGPPTLLRAVHLVWLTDKTPHEALPQQEDGYRQFFRLVTSIISLWFQEHSTPNPKVPLPSHIRVVKGNKFDGIAKI